jgi:hypothetical protein
MKKKNADRIMGCFVAALAVGLLLIVFGLAVVFVTAAIENVRLLFR